MRPSLSAWPSWVRAVRNMFNWHLLALPDMHLARDTMRMTFQDHVWKQPRRTAVLIYLIASFTLAIWVILYCLFFREQLTAWFANRFGKDKPPVSDTASTGPVEPLNYSIRPKDK